MVTVEDFHLHLDKCSRCTQEPNNLCAVGAELLKEAAASLPPLREVFPNLPFVPEWSDIEKQMLGKNMVPCSPCAGTGKRGTAICGSCHGSGRTT